MRKKENKNRLVSLKFTDEALSILTSIGKVGTPNQTRSENRLARIKRRLVNVLNALNRELVRHEPKIKVKQNLREIILEDGSRFIEV